MREYRADDGTMIRECKGCAGEYAIRTDEALESSGLVGEGCPWATVQQMAEDLEEVAAWMNRTLPSGFLEGVAGRAGMAAALLSSGSNP